MLRTPLRAAGAASLLLVLAACGSGSTDSASSTQAAPSQAASAAEASPAEENAAPSGDPITIGFIATLSGPLAEIGLAHQAGAQLAESMINAEGGILGRPVKVEFKDEQLDPKATVQAVNDFLGSGVNLLAGLTTDSDCLAAAPIVDAGEGVLVGASCQSNLLQTTEFVPAYFQIAPSNYMLSRGTAQLAASDFPNATTWDGVGPDYEFGREVWAEFRTSLEELTPGTEFRQDLYIPLTETQFTPYITQLVDGLPADSAEKDGLFLSTFSATTIGLAKQGQPLGLFDKYNVVLNLGGSTPTAEALGADTPPMWFIYDYYHGAYDNPTNTAFVDGYRAANDGKDPNAWAYEGYTAIRAYQSAIEAAGSTESAPVIDAMAGMTFPTPKGDLTFRAEDHLLQSPVTAWRVQGNPDSPAGFDVTETRVIDPADVLPPVNVG
jgi:branched-chain amino acid transport system substrate-binding protein